MPVPFTFPSASYGGFRFSTSLPTVNLGNLFEQSHTCKGIGLHYSVICIALMINHTEYLSLCLQAIYILPVMKFRL